MQQTIITEDVPAPQPSGVPQKSTTDSLVDAALDAMEGLVPSNDNGRTVKEPAPQREAPPAEEADEDVEEVPASDAEPDSEADEQSADEEDEAHDTRGSKEDPFSVKDLPEDKFIELKVDGEKMTVSLKELASGFIREQTFNARINKTKQMADEAQAAIERGKQMREQTRSAFKEFVSDSSQIFDFFMGDESREKVFEEAAVRYAAMLRRFRENPAEKLAWERQRDKQRLDAEREAFEAQKRAEHEERQRQEMSERAMKVFKPGWEAGLRKAGFPQPTQALYEEVMLRANQRAASGQPVTSDDITEFVVRACKLLELQPAGKNRPKPAAPPPPKDKTNGKPKRRETPWEQMSPAERRKDPDYFLRNLRPRDLR